MPYVNDVERLEKLAVECELRVSRFMLGKAEVLQQQDSADGRRAREFLTTLQEVAATYHQMLQCRRSIVRLDSQKAA